MPPDTHLIVCQTNETDCTIGLVITKDNTTEEVKAVQRVHRVSKIDSSFVGDLWSRATSVGDRIQSCFLSMDVENNTLDTVDKKKRRMLHAFAAPFKI